jgi:hypothetical protein
VYVDERVGALIGMAVDRFEQSIDLTASWARCWRGIEDPAATDDCPATRIPDNDPIPDRCGHGVDEPRNEGRRRSKPS